MDLAERPEMVNAAVAHCAAAMNCALDQMEKRNLLARWGLNYYGCCEPLDHKVHILRRIPRLRKISMNYRI